MAARVASEGAWHQRYATDEQKTREVLTCSTDTGNGGYTMRFFRAARTAKDLVGDRNAIAAWARLTYGWMGRSPDYKAAFLRTLGAYADFYHPFQDNAGDGIASRRKRFSIGITPSSILPSTGTGRRMKSPTSSSMSRRSGTTALSSAVRRSSRRGRRSRI